MLFSIAFILLYFAALRYGGKYSILWFIVLVVSGAWCVVSALAFLPSLMMGLFNPMTLLSAVVNGYFCLQAARQLGWVRR